MGALADVPPEPPQPTSRRALDHIPADHLRGGARFALVVPDREGAEPPGVALPPTPDVRAKLDIARRNGRRNQRIKQLPLFIFGLGCSSVAVALFLFSSYRELADGSSSRSVLRECALAMMFMAIFAFIAAILPTNRWPAPIMLALCIAAALVQIPSEVLRLRVRTRQLHACPSTSPSPNVASACVLGEALEIGHLSCVVSFELFLICIAGRAEWDWMRGGSVVRLRLKLIWLYTCFAAGLGMVTAITVILLPALGLPVTNAYAAMAVRSLTHLLEALLLSDERHIRTLQGCLAANAQATSSAVAIASLLCDRGPAEVYEMGIASLRAVSLGVLKEEHMLESRPRPELLALSVPITYGRVDAYICHSWKDDAATKWRALQSWREEFKVTHNREPLVFIDRICLNQQTLAVSLSCLPVFLAGCHSLVMLVGPTLFTRWWCLMEVFAYDEMMAGSNASIDVRLLDGRVPIDVLGDVRRATCTVPEERERLSSIVELSFGTLDAFATHIKVVLDRSTLPNLPQRRRSISRSWLGVDG